MAYIESSSERANFVLRYTLQSLAIVLMVAILLRTFFFSSYAMSGSAMLPTVLPGDFIIGTQLNLKQLKRGSIVALRCPQMKERLCLKRVVALSGDRVEFLRGQLILNGQVARYSMRGTFRTEAINGQDWTIWPSLSPKDAFEPVVVAPHSVFLLNDRRDDLEDSRTWGPVSMDYIESRVLRVWISINWYNGDQVRTWPQIRWDRVLRSID